METTKWAMYLKGKNEEPIFEVKENGDIILRGNVIANDKEVYELIISAVKALNGRTDIVWINE